MRIKDLQPTAQPLQELFKPVNAKWVQRNLRGTIQWETAFEFDDQLVEISITEDSEQLHLKHAIFSSNLRFKSTAEGYAITFAVEGDYSTTGRLGQRSAGLMAAVVGRIYSWLEQHKWDYITFTGGPGSRNRLYDSIARSLGKHTGSVYYFDIESNDFVVYKSNSVLQEQGGVGLVVPGVNMPAGQHPDEIRRQAKKFGFQVSAQGVPPLIKSSGKI